jgi:hypothetical protein
MKNLLTYYSTDLIVINKINLLVGYINGGEKKINVLK